MWSSSFLLDLRLATTIRVLDCLRKAQVYGYIIHFVFLHCFWLLVFTFLHPKAMYFLRHQHQRPVYQQSVVTGSSPRPRSDSD